jgi:hypothetical protein
MERMSEKPKGRRVGLRPFVEILGELSGGDIERDLTVGLNEVVKAVQDVGKPGKLTITIDVRRGPKMIQVSASIKQNVPKMPREVTAMYVDDTGNLQVENPRQTAMFSGPRPVEDDGGNVS